MLEDKGGGRNVGSNDYAPVSGRNKDSMWNRARDQVLMF